MDTDSRYVVSLIAPLPEADAFDAAGKAAPRLGVSRDRLAKLFGKASGTITRGLDYDGAQRIATILRDTGVYVRIARVGEPAPASQKSALASDKEEVETVDPAPDDWLEFEPAVPYEKDFDAVWQPGGYRRSRPRYRTGTRRDDVDVDEGPTFDWNQPLGFARWRRPVLLVALIAAIGIFALLQVDTFARGSHVDSAALFERGLVAYRTGDFGRALRVWDDAAATGDRRALYMLGYMSEFGQGQEWSNRRAAEFYRQAAERGSVQAQVALASLYERGLGVPMSERTAVRWYGIAAQNGHAGAQYQLALALLQGRGTERDYAAARVWFERAAENGIRDAHAFVTLLSMVSEVVPSSAEPIDRAGDN